MTSRRPPPKSPSRGFYFETCPQPVPPRRSGVSVAWSPTVLAATGALAIAASAIFVRLADTTPVTAAVLRTAYALPALLLLAVAERRRLGPQPEPRWRAAVVAGGFFAAGLIFWARSIFAIGAGIGTVLPNAQVVLVPLIAWALFGERPGRGLVAAIPLVLLGFVLLSGAVDNHAYGTHPLLGTGFGLITALAYSGFLLTFRRASLDRGRVATPLLLFTASAAAVSTLAGLASGGLDVNPGWRATGWLLATAFVSQVLGWLLISLAMPQLPMTVTSFMLTLQPVGAVILALIFLGEVPSSLQVVGIGSIVVAVLVAALRSAADRVVAEPPGARPPACCDRCRPASSAAAA
jgi:drug/metabolite transporter (DMT)-like permease